MALSVDEGGGETKEERASRVPSWVVGADERVGGGRELLKELMDQRTMLFSLAALEKIRSPYHVTLLKVC